MYETGWAGRRELKAQKRWREGGTNRGRLKEEDDKTPIRRIKRTGGKKTN